MFFNLLRRPNLVGRRLAKTHLESYEGLSLVGLRAERTLV
jgi:hypothetical protein